MANRPKVDFKKTTLDRAFRSEGVGMGDFNNDGLLDISAGSVWYENPHQPDVQARLRRLLDDARHRREAQ